MALYDSLHEHTPDIRDDYHALQKEVRNLKQWRPFTDALAQLSKVKALSAATPQKRTTPPPSNAGRGPSVTQLILAAGDTMQFATGGNDPKAEAWVKCNAPKFDVKYRKVRQGAFFIIEGKPDAITRFFDAGKQVRIVATRLPERIQQEKRPSPASGAHANVATQDVSHILVMQQNAPLPLADSSVFAALSQPDVGVVNVANLIDKPGAASNAPRSTSFSYFANRGPANRVGGQARLQPTGLVAIMHPATHTSHDEIEMEEPRGRSFTVLMMWMCVPRMTTLRMRRCNL